MVSKINTVIIKSDCDAIVREMPAAQRKSLSDQSKSCVTAFMYRTANDNFKNYVPTELVGIINKYAQSRFTPGSSVGQAVESIYGLCELYDHIRDTRWLKGSKATQQEARKAIGLARNVYNVIDQCRSGKIKGKLKSIMWYFGEYMLGRIYIK